MASQRQTYREFGPPLISSFDWNNLYHRTAVVSCLVQGVYRMERDRQKKRDLNSPTKDWWECVGFTLNKPLVDKKDNSIYGAVFRRLDKNHHYTSNSAVAPQFVIAFRGTIRTRKTLACDMQNNIRFLFENIHSGQRFEQMIQVIQTYVKVHEHKSVWIAGHSLGAGLALRAGKTMAMSGSPVEAYIFNPPSSLIPLEQLAKHHEDLKCGLRITRDIVKSLLNTSIITLFHNEVLEDHSYMKLASWRPHLFVNRSDPICSEYIGHLDYKNQMAEMGLELIERLAARCSVRSLVFGGREIHHLHSLPSALVIENTIRPTSTNPFKYFKTKHGIHQWWNPELERHSTTHLYEFHS